MLPLLALSCRVALPSEAAAERQATELVRVELRPSAPASDSVDSQVSGRLPWSAARPIVLRTADNCDLVSRAPAPCAQLSDLLGQRLAQRGFSVLHYDAYVAERRALEAIRAQTVSQRSSGTDEKTAPPPPPPEPTYAVVLDALQAGSSAAAAPELQLAVFSSNARGERGRELPSSSFERLASFAREHSVMYRRPATCEVVLGASVVDLQDGRLVWRYLARRALPSTEPTRVFLFETRGQELAPRVMPGKPGLPESSPACSDTAAPSLNWAEPFAADLAGRLASSGVK